MTPCFVTMIVMYHLAASTQLTWARIVCSAVFAIAAISCFVAEFGVIEKIKDIERHIKNM